MRVPVGLVLAWACAAGCGRLGFDASADGAVDPGPPEDFVLDLTACDGTGYVLTRASPATYLGPGGTYVTAPPDTARCTTQGVLVEAERTNHVWNSVGGGTNTDDFPSGWESQHDPVVSVNTTSAVPPLVEGTRTVVARVTDPDMSNYYQVMLDVPVTITDVDYTFSWFVRAPDPIELPGCETFMTFWTPGFTMQIGDAPTAVVAMFGQSWTRVTRVVRVPAGTGEIQPFINCSPNIGTTFTLELAMPQFERGAGATTPIKTTSGEATRAPERLVVDGASWMKANDGTIVLDVRVDDAQDRSMFVVTDADGAALVDVERTEGGWRVGGQGTTVSLPTAFAAGTHRVGVGFGSPAALAADGALATSGALAMPPGGALLIDALNGSVSRIRYWSRTLSDDELIAVTR